MMIGGNKDTVIHNIKQAVQNQEYNKKVETGDPDLSQKQKAEIVNRYLKRYRKPGYRFCNLCARFLANTVTFIQNRKTRLEGLENLKEIKSGAIVTCNHFNPLDNTVVRKAVKKAGHKRLFIVSQETNLAMKGFIGFMMRHTDTIPITSSKKYMNQCFPEVIKRCLKKKQMILIYPEQEMWFNYRKPRPPKRGAYYYAARNMVPIVSCFIEIRNLPVKETEEFYKTRYVMHILQTIYPDPNKSEQENSRVMMETDYRQKVEAYEKAYGKKLTYEFAQDDIAGLL